MGSYASIGGRVDVLWLQDNGPLSDLWQPFPTVVGQVYNVFFEVYVATADLLDCVAPAPGAGGREYQRLVHLDVQHQPTEKRSAGRSPVD